MFKRPAAAAAPPTPLKPAKRGRIANGATPGGGGAIASATTGASWTGSTHPPVDGPDCIRADVATGACDFVSRGPALADWAVIWAHIATTEAFEPNTLNMTIGFRGALAGDELPTTADAELSVADADNANAGLTLITSAAPNVVIFRVTPPSIASFPYSEAES